MEHGERTNEQRREEATMEGSTAMDAPSDGANANTLQTIQCFTPPRTGRKSTNEPQETSADDEGNQLVGGLQTLSVNASSMSSERDVVTPTPELSAATMHRIRGSSCSPSHSAVSVGSFVNPLKFELTPVINNTSDMLFDNTIVTPNNDTLHGEHLAMPADLDTNTEIQIPPLKPSRGSFKDLSAPIPLPSRRHNTFTTREEYEEAAFNHDDDDDDALFQPSDSEDEQPYYPRSRPALDFSDSDFQHPIPHSIFNPHEPIPMEQRIPSLHMAQELQGDSTTTASFTDNEDNIIEDNESLGDSIGSLQVDEDDYDSDDPVIRALQRKQRKRKQLIKEQAAQEWIKELGSNHPNGVMEAASSKFLNQQPANKVSPKPSELKRHISSPPAS